MAFVRKAGNVIGRVASNRVSQEIPTSKPSIFQAIRCMSSSKLFVGGLSFSTDDATLKEAFSKYGHVAEARVVMDPDTGMSRRFAYVTYSSTDEAAAALQALHKQKLFGRRIRVKYPDSSGYESYDFDHADYSSDDCDYHMNPVAEASK